MRFGVLSLEDALEDALAPNVGVAVCAREAPGRTPTGGLIVGTLLVIVPASTRWFWALMLGGCRYAMAWYRNDQDVWLRVCRMHSANIRAATGRR
jgi:hypothetical protein